MTSSALMSNDGFYYTINTNKLLKQRKLQEAKKTPIGKVLFPFLLCPCRTDCFFQAFSQPKLQSSELQQILRSLSGSLGKVSALGDGFLSTGLVRLLHFRLLVLYNLHCLVSKILHSRDIYLHRLHSFQGKHGLLSHQEGSLNASWSNPAK